MLIIAYFSYFARKSGSTGGPALAFLSLGILCVAKTLMAGRRSDKGGFDFALSADGVELHSKANKGSPFVIPYDAIERFEIEGIGHPNASMEYIGMRIGEKWHERFNAYLGVGARPIRTYLMSNDVFVALVPTSSVEREDELVATFERVRTLPKGKCLS